MTSLHDMITRLGQIIAQLYERSDLVIGHSPPARFSFFLVGQWQYLEWNGMIKEVMVGTEEGGADFAIADLSVTSQRNEAVQFMLKS